MRFCCLLHAPGRWAVFASKASRRLWRRSALGFRITQESSGGRHGRNIIGLRPVPTLAFCQFLLISSYVYCKNRIFSLSKIFARSAAAAFPLRCGLGLLLCSVLQFVAWQFDVGWVRRLSPPFLAIVPWSVVGFFLMSLIVIFLLWRSGPVQLDSKLRPRSWERSSDWHFPDFSWNTSFSFRVATWIRCSSSSLFCKLTHFCPATLDFQTPEMDGLTLARIMEAVAIG